MSATPTEKRLTIKFHTIFDNVMIYRSKGYNIGGTQKRYHTVEKPSVKRDCSGQTSKFMELKFVKKNSVCRSEFGKMLMTIQEVQTLHEINQLKMKNVSSTRLLRIHDAT